MDFNDDHILERHITGKTEKVYKGRYSKFGISGSKQNIILLMVTFHILTTIRDNMDFGGYDNLKKFRKICKILFSKKTL